MSRIDLTCCVIFSACLDHRTDSENEQATAEVANYLTARDIPFEVAQGCYRGSKEESFVVQEAVWDTDPNLRSIVFGDHEQECVLTVANGVAELEFEDYFEPIGSRLVRHEGSTDDLGNYTILFFKYL